MTESKETKTIELSKGYKTIVDAEDYAKLSGYKWHASPQGRYIYAASTTKIDGKRKNVRMHRVIMGVTDRKIYVDHINHDTLDNRKCNLRPCTPQQNVMNGSIKPKRNGTIKYKGIFEQKKNKRWVATIMVESKVIWLGAFDTQKEAALAYDIAALEHHGEFARTNKILGLL